MNEELDLEEFAPWFVGAITLAGVFLRVVYLDSKGMWLDETFSVWMAGHSLPELLQWLVRIDQHPPLYYFLLHFWTQIFGDTPYYARLLSALIGAATIPIIYLIGARLSGAALGLAAAVLLAVSPFHINFGQETRMYALLTFNAAVAIYALTRLLTAADASRPIGSQVRDYLRARRWSSISTVATDLSWLVLIVFSVATMLTHNTAVLFPLAINVFVLGLLLWQRLKRAETPLSLQAPPLGNWVKAQIAIFLLWSPWLYFFVRQASAVDQRFWIPAPTWDAVVNTLRGFLNASAPMSAAMAAAVWLLYGAVFVLGVMHFQRQMARWVFLATLFIVPFLGELIVSIRRPIFYDRTLIWTTIPLFLLLAAGVVQVRWRFAIITLLGLLVTLNLFSAADYYRFYRKEDWGAAAGYVANFAEKDDLVLFNSNFVAIPFDYYFAPYEALYAIEVVKRGVPLDLVADGVLEPQMTEADVPALLASLAGHDRVWLVYSHEHYTDPSRIISDTLASEMELIRQRDFYGGQVRLYAAP
jgi:mannosyltransferase